MWFLNCLPSYSLTELYILVNLIHGFDSFVVAHVLVVNAADEHLQLLVSLLTCDSHESVQLLCVEVHATVDKLLIV